MKRYFPFLYIIFFFIASCAKPNLPKANFLIDFQQAPPGKLPDRETKRIWKGASLVCGKKDYLFYKLGITSHPHFISEEGGNRFLKVKIPPNFFGPITGAQWKIPFKSVDECFLSYRIKFEDNFNFCKGGKLPGLAGGTANSGGHVPNGYDGWSTRMMFWEGGNISLYAYFAGQTSKWGERFYLRDSVGDKIRITPGKWHTVAQYVKMNSTGRSDGILEAWFDGKKAFYSDTILFRKDPNIRIDQIFYSVFLGGDDLTWASPKKEYICFDDFRVSTQPLNN